MATDAQLKSEIARLTATINQHKSDTQGYPSYTRSNTYLNPNYRPPNKYIRQLASEQNSQRNPSSRVKEIVLNGVAFESSSRSLVRKDMPKPPSAGSSKLPALQAPSFSRKLGHPIPTTRIYKPKSTRGLRGRPTNRNMTLTNGRRPYHPRSSKQRKYLNKPCPRFSTTGACSRGLTCIYQHDPSKIAICWNFLQDNCPNTAETCNLSHDPTPERTPLCLHFLNKGRCTRDKCPFPHVNVGARCGVCRDFAVLGYCEKGLDCEHQHVRECPNFAEKGTCTVKGCKLPHVIRANRYRKPASSSAIQPPSSSMTPPVLLTRANPVVSTRSNEDSIVQPLRADSGQIGDEYISLTFIESDDSDDDESDVDEIEDGADGEEQEASGEDGNSSDGNPDDITVHA